MQDLRSLGMRTLRPTAIPTLRADHNSARGMARRPGSHSQERSADLQDVLDSPASVEQSGSCSWKRSGE